MADRPTLTTDRLILRAFTQDDAPRVTELAGAWEIADTTEVVPHPYALDDATTWIATHAAHWEQGRAAEFAITDGASGDLYGAIGLAIDRNNERGGIGYWIGVPYWNRGYCTEAARAVLAFAFDDLGLHRVAAEYLIRNPASGRVMEKIGMRHEGVRHDAIKKWDKYEDVGMYAVLADQWRALRGSA